MRDNPYDEALDKTLSLIEKVSDKMAKDFRGVKPFQTEPIAKKKLLGFYNQLTPEDMTYFVEQYGEEVVGDFIREMELEKQNA